MAWDVRLEGEGKNFGFAHGNQFEFFVAINVDRFGAPDGFGQRETVPLPVDRLGEGSMEDEEGQQQGAGEME